LSFLTSDLPTTLLLIAIGVIIGAALSKILNRGPNPAELQQKLEESQEQLKAYQQEVGSHFQKTAELVNGLTQSYRAVHEHLAQGAQSLAQNTSGNTLESTQFKALSDANVDATAQPEASTAETNSTEAPDEDSVNDENQEASAKGENENKENA
jgi:uncharacterized membrane-anchored protein YhcB (DUF1043 family)